MKCKATHWTSNRNRHPLLYRRNGRSGAERCVVCSSICCCANKTLIARCVLSPATECRYRLSFVWFSPSFISASTSRITFIHMCPLLTGSDEANAETQRKKRPNDLIGGIWFPSCIATKGQTPPPHRILLAQSASSVFKHKTEPNDIAIICCWLLQIVNENDDNLLSLHSVHLAG